jgi:hypothetical protein
MSSQGPQPDNEKFALAARLRRAFEAEPLSAQQLARICGQVADAWRTAHPVRRRSWRRWVAALALPLLAGLAGVAYLQERASAIVAIYSGGLPGNLELVRAGAAPTPLANGAPLVAGSFVVARGAGELRWLRGGILRLQAGARLRVVDRGVAELQSGSLYVALVGPHAADVLAVRTPFGTVQHIGTRFLLTVSGDAIDLSVREGSLRLSGPQSVDLGAGHAVHIDGAGHIAHHALRAGDPAWTWVGAPLYPFDPDGQTMLALLQWVAQERQCALLFDDDATRRRAEQTILHGAIRGLSVDDALAQMLATTTLTADFAGDVLHVHGGPAPTDHR